jgi:hypothetical protein
VNPLGTWDNVAWEAEGGMKKWLWAYSEGKFWYSTEGAENPHQKIIGPDFDPGKFLTTDGLIIAKSESCNAFKFLSVSSSVKCKWGL